jgi:hypothetical protein
MASSAQSYIIAARITQGHLDYDDSTPEERQSIIENYKTIKDDPKLYRHPSQLNQSSNSLKQKFHSHHSDTDLGQTETNGSTHSQHSSTHALHLDGKHNASESNLKKSETGESQKSTHSHHSIRHALHLDHKHNYSSPELNKQSTTESETNTVTEDAHRHKHSLRAHFHRHKHEGGTISETASETDLAITQKDIPIVREAEVSGGVF